jgi:hypothetical protein
MKWTNLTDLKATIWNDVDYMPRDFLRKGYHIAPELVDGNASASQWHEGYEDPAQVIADQTRVNNHRFRQITFVTACLKHVRTLGGSYTIHIDTDEYVVVNPILRQRYYRRLQQLLEEQQNNYITSTDENAVFIARPSRPMPLNITPVSEPNAILSILQQIESNKRRRKNANLPCLSMPRLLFGSEEDHPMVQDLAMPRQLETLRWKYHTAYDDVERNAQPKVIVDVSKVRQDDEMFRPKAFSIHRPSKRLCRRIDQLDMTMTPQYPLVVNHYVGTYERYMGRNDTRRSQRRYEFKAHVKNGTDTWIQSWYQGFIRIHGVEMTNRLLFE